MDAHSAVIATAGLCTAFVIKHYLADFVFQTTWMARGKERASDWLAPLLVHVGCHAGLTLALALVVAPRMAWLALADFGVHFAMDRAKSIVARRGGWRIDQPAFWWLLGFDQLVHHLTNVTLAAALMIGGVLA